MNGKKAWRLIEGNTTRWTWKEVDVLLRVHGKLVKGKAWRGGPR